MTEFKMYICTYFDSIEDLDIPQGGNQWESKKATKSQSNSKNRGMSTFALVNYASKTKYQISESAFKKIQLYF